MKFKKLTKIIAAITTAGVFLAGCTSSTNTATQQTEAEASEGGTIKIASKPMTEQFILSEMLGILIEQDTNLDVEITKGIGGGTTNIHPALLNGEFDLYPEYTATSWFTVLKKTETPESEDALYDELVKEYEALGLTWTGLYGFNNTYTLAMNRQKAEQLQINTISELANVSNQVIFGGNYDYIEREDGYPALCQAYGLNFKQTKDMDIGLKYTALEEQEIDVTNAFTTDAQLSSENIKVLEDDKHFFTNYYCGTVVRMDTLEKYPQLKTVLEKMNGILTDTEMAKMNYAVEVEEQDEHLVAENFLKEKGLID